MWILLAILWKLDFEDDRDQTASLEMPQIYREPGFVKMNSLNAELQELRSSIW